MKRSIDGNRAKCLVFKLFGGGDSRDGFGGGDGDGAVLKRSGGGG